MFHFWIALIFGVVVIGLLLLLFLKVEKRSAKVRAAEREFIYNCGDESLVKLYEQADSDKERQDIAEFAKEKIAMMPDEQAAEVSEHDGTNEVSGDTRENILAEDMFAAAISTFNDEERALFAEQGLWQEAEPDVDAVNSEMPETAAPTAHAAADFAVEPVNEDEAAEQLQQLLAKADMAKAEIEHELPGLTNVFAGSAIHGLAGEAEALAQAERDVLGLSADPGSGVDINDDLLPQEDATYEGKTRVLPLNEVDWNSVEAELQKKREEEARVMAENLHIQEVFTKVKNIESRLLQEDDTTE